MADRFPPPGPSFITHLAVPLGGASGLVGLTEPSHLDEQWLTVLWVGDDDGACRFSELAPRAGPPPDPPLLRLGPALAGGLSGLIAEVDGRLAIRLAPVAPSDDPARPWRTPAIIRAAFGFEPTRAAILSDRELAALVLDAFRGAVRGLSRP